MSISLQTRPNTFRLLERVRDCSFLILHLPLGPGSAWDLDAILDSVRRCEIPYDERGILIDRVKGQILVPVKIALTESHLSCLKSRLPATVTGIEVSSPTI